MTREPGYEHKLVWIQLSDILRPQIIDRIDIDMIEIEALSKSIFEQGLIQAPVLRPSNGKFEIVAGDRRIMAVKILKWEKVQCVVKEMTDLQAAEIRATENINRESLTVIEEANIYKNLHKIHGLSLEQVGRRMSRSVGTVKRRMDLLKMPTILQTAMHKKQISYGVAEALWVITEEAALDYYLGFAIDHGVTVAIARQWANDWKAAQRRIVEKDLDPVDALESPATRPTYIACDFCEAPELVQDLTLVRLCRACAQEISLQKSKK